MFPCIAVHTFLFFPAAVAHPGCFSVVIIDDDELENDREDLQLLLSPSPGYESAVNLATPSINISIVDDDRGRVGICIGLFISWGSFIIYNGICRRPANAHKG